MILLITEIDSGNTPTLKTVYVYHPTMNRNFGSGTLKGGADRYIPKVPSLLFSAMFFVFIDLRKSKRTLLVPACPAYWR